MSNKKRFIQEPSKVVIFAGEQPNEYCILLDQNSNMVNLFFEVMAELTTPDPKEKVFFNINIAAGTFGSRKYFKLTIFKCDYKKIQAIAVYINLNVLMYANEIES